MGRRGQGKHMKRINAPKHLMLDKLGGIFVRRVFERGGGRGESQRGAETAAAAGDREGEGWAHLAHPPTSPPTPQAPKPSPGPHKQRECLPLVLMLRNRLK